MKRQRNCRGQMAVFIALIFQVLFVFFAMVINVGLLVHHKINLQNAVDLAAYYAASKQAEVFNAIAHQNYQIRQSWKLLSWRYRVLSTLGAREHPSWGGAANESAWNYEPVSCTTWYPMWLNTPEQETSCYRVYTAGGYRIPALPIPRVIAGFIGFNSSVKAFAERMRDVATSRCEFLGPANWMFTSRIFLAYRKDQANRKQIMYSLARNLSGNTNDFIDLDGQSVSEGARKTLLNNLTDPNRQSVIQLDMLNSMGLGQCRNPETWLSEINVAPTMLYADFTGGGANACSLDVKFVNVRPEFYDIYRGTIDPQGQIIQQMQVEPPDNPERSSVGVEKNPWCMGYVGMRASTQPRIPFAPVGGAMTLRARAFAKPFGGRIGPWYQSQWAFGSERSSGGRRTDPLLPPRINLSGNIEGPGDLTRLPNYSRFPGDRLGLKSRQALAVMGQRMQNQRLYIEHVTDAALTVFDDPQTPGDPVIWDTDNNRSIRMRDYELAGILPDLFDVTYYSIEPNYFANYFLRMDGRIPLQNRLRPDLGWRNQQPPYDVYSVQEQYRQGMSNTYNFDNLPWVIRPNFQNNNFGPLLTAWSQRYPATYDLSPDFFGQCLLTPRNNAPPNPGNCIMGGRTGYSVKLVARDYLTSGNLPLGGEGAGTGPLLNPPTDF